MGNFRELRIWQEGISIAKRVYEITLDLPSEEKFGLVSQMRKCGVSIPSNIAEGYGRGTDPSLRHFLDISLGSAFELETQLILTQDLFQINGEELIKDLQVLQRQIRAFQNKLK